MEWILLLAIGISYYSLSEKIKKISIQHAKNKKEFPSLKNLLNKNIEVEIINNLSKTGILKKYDDIWIVIETKDNKNGLNLNYYRLSNVLSINIIKD